MVRLCDGCLGLKSVIEWGLCRSCHRDILRQLDNGMVTIGKGEERILGYCFFRYGGLVRDMILRGKLYREERAWQALMRIVLSQIALEHLMPWSHVVMAAPPSVMGKLRGQYDISYLWARTLAQSWQKSFVRWPLLFPLTQANKRMKTVLQQPVLLVDDVLTTGQTLLKTRQKLKYPQMRFLVIARSR